MTLSFATIIVCIAVRTVDSGEFSPMLLAVSNDFAILLANIFAAVVAVLAAATAAVVAKTTAFTAFNTASS